MNVVVSHWSANLVVLTAYLVTAVAHLLGVRTVAARSAEAGTTRPAGRAGEAIAFQVGLLLVLLALVSPMGYWSQVYVWARSLQDLLLALVAPGLIVLGAPWQPLRAALRMAPALGGAEADEPDRRPSHGWLTVPAAVAAGYNLLWLGWHLPVLYDASARHVLVGAAEVITYLGGGILLWLQLIGSRPHTPAFAPIYRVMLVTGTMVVGTVLGMFLVFGSGTIYPGYRTALHLHPYSVVADQQVGGAVLWLLAMPPLLIVGVALLIQWLNDEEAEAVGSGLDRMLRPPKPVWPVPARKQMTRTIR